MNNDGFLEWLIQFLNDRDLIDLCTEDGPDDEYRHEAKAIVAALPSCKNSDELAEALHAIFIEYFNPEIAGGGERYVEAAHHIYQQWMVRD
jgi:hypothetical protein